MECDGCTICCDLFPVPDLNKSAYSKCVHCKAGKCLIYLSDERPDVCRTFYCMYAQVSDLDVDLRPDKCGVVFEKINEKLIFGIQSPDIKQTERAIRQVKSFINEGYSVVIKERLKRMCFYIAPGHTAKEVEQDINERLITNGYIRN